jgi:ABC-type amino acid transport substrate-binding protein
MMLAAVMVGLVLTGGGPATYAQGGCGNGGTVDGIAVPKAADSPTVARICKQGTIRAALAPFAPHGFQDANGTFRGASVEIVAPAIAKLLDVKLEVIPVGWDTVVAGLQAGRYELVTTGLTFTPEREKLIDYAIFAVGGTCYMVRKDSDIRTPDDLNSPSVTIGLYTGTSWETDLPKLFPKAKFDAAIEGPGGGYRTVDLMTKRIDAAPIDNVAVLAIESSYPHLRVVPEGDACISNPKPVDRVGIGMPKDSAFKAFVEAMVLKNKESMDAVMKKYMTPEYIKVGHE